MTRLEFAKKVVAKVATIGSGIIVTAIVHNNLPGDLSLPKKTAAFAGAFVLGAIVADAVEDKTNSLVDDLVAAYKQIQTQFNS